MGVLQTDSSGKFVGKFPLPDGLELGAHTIQVDGFSANNVLRSANIPAVLVAPVQKSLRARFYFAPNSSKLTAESQGLIKSFAKKILPGYFALRVSVNGFVYPYDSKIANAKLSAARAKVIAAALRGVGLKGVFLAKGTTVRLPASATSRRVEVTLSYQVKSATK